VADFFFCVNIFVATFIVVSAKFIILIFRIERVSQFIAICVELIYTIIMEVSQSIRKKVRSGRAVMFEPQNLELINEDSEIRVSFEQARCMHFCESIKVYNVKLVEHFSLNFTRVSVTIARITF